MRATWASACQPARKATGTDKPHIERTLGSVASLFAQFVAGYTGPQPGIPRPRRRGSRPVWSLAELQELLDEWLIAVWQNRPHDGLRDPLHPGRAFTPNEKYAALVEAAGYVPVALSAEDYIELLPGPWRAVNAYGIKIGRRTYDGEELNPLRLQPSGVAERKDLWEVHHDPYDVSRIWVRDHWNGGWITVFWTHLHRVAAPFGELAWDHARQRPGPAAHRGRDRRRGRRPAAPRRPGPDASRDEPRSMRKRDRRVAARTKAASRRRGPGSQARPGTASRRPGAGAPGRRGRPAGEVIPMPIFDPFGEAEKWW